MHEFYHQFNEALSRGLDTSPFEASAAMANSRLQEGSDFPDRGELSGEGSLVVQVTLARDAIPVQGAKVIVSSAEGSPVVISEMITDQSGRTPRLSLPAPRSIYSQTPGGTIRPYSIYNIDIAFPGYYTEKAINVPIFDQIQSIQPISLLPLPEDRSNSGEIIIDESEQGPLQ